jgi:hypothetical protein
VRRCCRKHVGGLKSQSQTLAGCISVAQVLLKHVGVLLGAAEKQGGLAPAAAAATTCIR